MKKEFLFIIIAVMVACVNIGCREDDSEEEKAKETITLEEINVPVDALTGKAEKNTLYIIRSKGELQEYVNIEDFAVQEINFAKFSLLLVTGRATNGIVEISTQFSNEKNENKKLLINILLNDTAEAPLWCVAALSPAIPAGELVDLDIQSIR